MVTDGVGTSRVGVSGVGAHECSATGVLVARGVGMSGVGASTLP